MTLDLSRLDHEQALAERKADDAERPDPGTTRGHPTLRIGTVTQVSPLRVTTVNGTGLPASLFTSDRIVVGTTVLLLVDAGRRFVVGASGGHVADHDHDDAYAPLGHTHE